MQGDDGGLAKGVIADLENEEKYYDIVRPSYEAVLYYLVSRKFELSAFNGGFYLLEHANPTDDQSDKESAEESCGKKQAEDVGFEDLDEVVRIVEQDREP